MAAFLVLVGCNLSPQAKIIPRQALFSAPEHVQARVSPNGKYLSFLGPVGGVLNIWVAPSGDVKAARPLTNDQDHGIFFHTWSANNHTILYRQDRAGTQNWRIYAVDVRTGHEIDLTPFDGIQARIVGLSAKHPNQVLLGINKRDQRWHDVYLADLATGELTLVEQNSGFSSFVADKDLKLRFAVATTEAGGLDIYQKTDSGWRKTSRVPPDDAMSFRFLDFNATDKRVYLIDSRGRGTSALTRFTPSTGETEVLGQDARADISSVLYEPQTNEVQAFVVNYQRPQWKVIDPSIEEDLKLLSATAGPSGEFDVVSRTRDDSTWVVHIDHVTRPGVYYLYRRATRSLTPLFTTRPQLNGAPLVSMYSAMVRARDGTNLVAYYSLPKSADRNGDGKPNHRSPLIVFVHGGPWARDKYGFSEWHQWLANRGYAVLSVNFRGSAGFGKAFMNAANRQWGKAVLGDIEDAAQWAIDDGIADPQKTAIFGGHYGGYAALEALATKPDSFNCGVAIGGASNLVAMMSSIPPLLDIDEEYFAPTRRQSCDAQWVSRAQGAITCPARIANRTSTVDRSRRQ